jgi:streptogramin lyase
MRLRAIVSGATLTLALLVPLVPAAAAAPTGALAEFGIPSEEAQPYGIAPGPDGALWFTENRAAKIGRIAPGGEVTEFTIPNAEPKTEVKPTGIATGPDGNLWFAEYGKNKVVRMTPSGAISEFEVPTPASGPFRITLGPDGDMWFVEEKAGKVGRITPAGAITEFPTPGGGPTGIAAGSDGNLWFTETSANKIGRVSPEGTFAEFPVPTPKSGLEDIAAGPDGNLWFTEFEANKIGRITPAGVVSEFELPGATGSPEWIASGADGNLWFSETEGNKVGRITPAGAITEYELAAAKTGPTGIAPGADGNLWFAEYKAGRIGRIGVGVAEALASAPAVTGGGEEGSSQTCGVAWTAWLGLQPQTSLLGFDGDRWLLDGAPVASGSSYTPSVANIGHRLACAVTVTYPLPLFVSAVATSAAVTVTAPATPIVARARQSAATWREGRALARISRTHRRRRPPVGTTFSFGLNVQASVSLTFTQARAGRRAGHRCLARTRRNARRRRCTRTVIVGRLTFGGHTGTNAVAFQGRVSSANRLSPGRYTVVIAATNTVGAASAPVALRFRIAR